MLSAGKGVDTLFCGSNMCGHSPVKNVKISSKLQCLVLMQVVRGRRWGSSAASVQWEHGRMDMGRGRCHNNYHAIQGLHAALVQWRHCWSGRLWAATLLNCWLCLIASYLSTVTCKTWRTSWSLTAIWSLRSTTSTQKSRTMHASWPLLTSTVSWRTICTLMATSLLNTRPATCIINRYET